MSDIDVNSVSRDRLFESYRQRAPGQFTARPENALRFENEFREWLKDRGFSLVVKWDVPNDDGTMTCNYKVGRKRGPK